VRIRLHVSLHLKTPATISAIPGKPTGSGIKTRMIARLPDGRAWFAGTELKGVVRNTAEILSRSCVHSFDPEPSYSYRPVAHSEPGVLERTETEWVIHTTIKAKGTPNGVAGSETLDRKKLVSKKFLLKVATKELASKKPGKVAKNYWAIDSLGQPMKGMWVIREAAADTSKDSHQFFVDPKEPAARSRKISVNESVVNAADEANHGRYERDAEDKKTKPAKFDVVLGGGTCTRPVLTPYKTMTKDSGLRPIWYRLDQNKAVVELGPVALHRVAYTRHGELVTIGDTLDRSGPSGARKIRSCSELTFEEISQRGVCTSCVLFGFTNPNLGESTGLAGRIQFSTMTSAAPVPESKVVVLKPLSSPKASAQTFYLHDPKHPNVAEAQSYANPGAQLRGRKFYWHQIPTTEDDVTIPAGQLRAIGGSAEIQLQAHELVPAGTVYTGTVTIAGATLAEAGLVVAALDPNRLSRLLSANKSQKLFNSGIKIGGGKPLGLGSAAVTIDAIEEIDLEARYRQGSRDLTTLKATDNEQGVNERLDSLVKVAIQKHDLTTKRTDIEALLAALRFDAVPQKQVGYPPGTTQGKPWESFSWFMRFGGRGNLGEPVAAKGGEVDILRTAKETVDGERQTKS
jgi:CRISPR-associated protein (TIGR03986 family)